MSQAGIVDVEGSHPQIPTSFITNSGTAIPLANVLEILGTTVAAHSIPLRTTGSGNTVTIEAQYASAAASSVGTNAGFASFISTQFNVDANGFVSLNGSVVAQTITGNTGGALSPTAGNWNILGTSTAAGAIPVQTSGSGSTLTVQVQKSQAIASTNATNVGLAAFNSAFFTVDANGFVSINGAAIGETITGNVGGALSPTAGNWNILGTSTAAGTTPVQTSGTGSTLTVQVQKAQAIASTNATNVGLAAFDSAAFDVDANGFVQLNGGGIAATAFDVQANTAPGTDPVVPTAAGVVTVNGAAVANHSVVLETRSRAANAYNLEVQYATSAAATDATKSGVAHFDSARFSVDANGFVSLSGTGALQTLSDDVGTTITPAAGNIQLVGHVVEQGATKFSTVVAGTNLANINPMSSSRWIVDPLGFNGTHTTITSAITSATSGDTIFILPGTYTENPTLKAGVNLTAYQGDGYNGHVIINGKCTMTTAGTVVISGIELQTNSDFFLAVTGSAASIVYLVNCVMNALNNTGISHTSSSSSSILIFIDCQGSIGTTGITLFVSTSAGSMSFQNCILGNGGGSTTPSSVSTGSISFFEGLVGFPCSTSSVGVINTDHASFNTGNATCLTTAGTGGGTLQFTEFQSGTASALSIGSGTSVNLFTCNINSQNTNAITGAGTINYSDVSYCGNSTTINTTTQSIKPSSCFQTIVRQVFTASGTYTPTAGMKNCDIEVLGGGGGGGGVGASPTVSFSVGGGGGAGGYSKKAFTAATIGASQSVTIGAAGANGAAGGAAGGAGGTGGTTSVGALISATGGIGGAAGVVQSVAPTGAAGGAGGVGSSGDFNANGAPGGMGFGGAIAALSFAVSGVGGSSIYGGGGLAVSTTTGAGTSGLAGTLYGAGGSGGVMNNQNAGQTGGAGSAGIVIITEYV